MTALSKAIRGSARQIERQRNVILNVLFQRKSGQSATQSHSSNTSQSGSLNQTWQEVNSDSGNCAFLLYME